MKVFRYIRDNLAKVVHELMAEWKVHHVLAKADGKHRDALEGTWVSVSRIEIPGIYFLYSTKAHQISV